LLDQNLVLSCVLRRFTFGFILLLMLLLVQTLEMLEKKENVLLKKATGEVEKAKEFSRAKNKRGMANFCSDIQYIPCIEINECVTR